MDRDNEIQFGQWLRARRRALDLTRERLAECVGCSAATIEKLETGERKPSRQIAELLARCIRVPKESLAEFVLFARGGPAFVALDDFVLRQPLTRDGVHLPASPTEFVGRSAELERVRTSMKDDGVRLLTILGPPGIGKTRLALEAASGMASLFENGVYFVPLSGLANVNLVVPTIAGQLGIRQWSHQPVLDALVERLRERWLLLVLDNLEHLLPAAPDIGILLAGAPGLKVLATSRTALHIYGEHTFVVPPMSVPSVEDAALLQDLSRYEAISLFVRRARAVNQDFALTSENAGEIVAICRRLDGLPLAIELAANRARVLSPGQILERLASSLGLLVGGASDLPSRQRSLRGAIAWGYDLLNEGEQRLFRLMSVFAGGCPLDALQEMAVSGDGREMGVVDDLSALVSSSLVGRQESADGARFFMLDTIREFAWEQLVEQGEAVGTRRKHAEFYLRLAEQAEPELQGGDQIAWLQRLEQEHDNIRAAYSYFLEVGDGVSLARMVSSLRRFWYLHGNFSEGHEWLRQALALEDRLPDLLLARVLHGLGTLEWSVGDLKSAVHHFSESLAIWRVLDDRRGIADMLNNLGIALLPQGKYDEARAHHRESLEIYRELDDSWSISLALANLGLVALDSGEYEEAEGLLRESLDIRRVSGDEQGLAQSLNNLGIVARCKGDIELSCALHKESIEMFRGMGDRWTLAMALSNLGHTGLGGGLASAPRYFLESLDMFRDLGAKQGVAGCFEGLAQVAGWEGRDTLAACLFGVAEELRVGLATITPYNLITYKASRAAVAARLGVEAFQTAWQHGSRLDLEGAYSLVADAWAALVSH